MSRSWLLCVDDLIFACEKLSRIAAARSCDECLADETAFDAALFKLRIIGEAVKRLPPEALARLSEPHRRGPARLRELIAHHYFAVDPDLLWEAVSRHMPILLDEARALRESFDAGCLSPGGSTTA